VWHRCDAKGSIIFFANPIHWVGGVWGGVWGGIHRAQDPRVNSLISPDSCCKYFLALVGGGGVGGSNRLVPPII
jgi:hypothetical protein